MRPRFVLACAAAAAVALPRGSGAQVAPATPQAGARVSALEQQILLQPRQAMLYLDLARVHQEMRRLDQAEADLRLGIARGALPPRLLPLALADILAAQSRWADAVDAMAPLRGDSLVDAQTAKLQVNAGLEAYQRGDGAEARRRWSAALAIDPNLLEAALNLGALLVEQQDLAGARAVAEQAIRRHPGNARLEALRAATLTGPEGMKAAVSALRLRRAERPGDEAVGLELAQLLRASGAGAEATALFDTLLAYPGPSERVFVDAAELHLDASRVDAAAKVLERGVEHYARSADLWTLLGEAEGTRNDWPGSARAYARAVPLADPPEAVELRLADAQARAADTAAAVQVLRGMVTRPAPREALLEAGRKAADLGAPALADTAFSSLLAGDPEDVDALEAALGVAERLGNRDRAVELARRETALDGSGPAPFLALLRLAPPSPDTAQLYLRRAIWRGLDRLQGQELQVAAAAQAGGTLRSLAQSRPVFQRRDATASTVRTLLDTVVFHTAWGEAELDRLRGAFPMSSLLDRYAADLAALRGRNAEALSLYESLLARSPADAGLQRARAAVLEQSGRADEAAAAWARALEVEPENAQAFRALVALHQARGTLEDLLGQVRRLQVRLPDSALLVEHEVETLQRLGRTEEAQAAAARLKGVPAP